MRDMSEPSFGKKMRTARLCARDGEGLSYGQVSRLTRFSPQSLAEMESGHLAPPRKTEDVLALATAFQISNPRDLVRAAVAERKSVTLTVEPDRIALASDLAIAWPTLSKPALDKMAKVIQEARNG